MSFHHPDYGHKPVATPPSVTSVDPDELIPHDRTAEMLRIRSQTLTVWRGEGRGPRWLKVGRQVFYRREDICSWLATQLSEAA